MLGISRTPPYHGWGAFRVLCKEVLEAARDTQLIDSLERYSFKCINLLDLRGRYALSLLNAQFALSDYEISNRGFRLRAEMDHGAFVNVLEFVSEASVNDKGSTRSGLLFTLDTIRSISSEAFWPSMLDHIDAAHSTLKEIFFRLLKPEVIDEYGPTWSTE
jgi:uncharacterized protein (TIGR04255 family)